MQTIAFYNRKGGIGKTTHSRKFATYLAELGHKVLLIDGDSQCDLTSDLQKLYPSADFTTCTINDLIKIGFKYRLSPNRWEGLKFDFLNKIIKINDCLHFISGANTDCGDLCTTIGLGFSATNNTIRGMLGDFFMQSISGILDAILAFPQQQYDYVIFDMSPSISNLNNAIFYCLDKIVCPVTNENSIKNVALLQDNITNWNLTITNVVDSLHFVSEAHKTQMTKEKSIVATITHIDTISQSELGDVPLCKTYSELLEILNK